MLTMRHAATDLDSQNSGLVDSNVVQLIDAWEMARSAYEQVLADGVDRSDIELAHDENYNKLLTAGQLILRLGGAKAVSCVARRLGTISIEASEHHFKRLWCGLIEEKIGRAN